jgi:hypothetical protein
MKTLDKSFRFFEFMQSTFDSVICEKIFGLELDHHMYTKWLETGQNIVAFISRLDSSNRTIFLNYMKNLQCSFSYECNTLPQHRNFGSLQSYECEQ